MEINSIIANELNIKVDQVNKTIELIDGGNTIPFIARYRKEVTGNLSDEQLRNLDQRLTYLRNLEEEKHCFWIYYESGKNDRWDKKCS